MNCEKYIGLDVHQATISVASTSVRFVFASFGGQ
jgi:hypothetical protein